MSLIDRVRRTLQREQLTTPTTRVVVALSGGPDSTALAHVMRALHDEGQLQFVALAHLNHQLRSAASADAEFCVRMAASLDRPITVEAADVGARAAAERRSVEDAAHAARYEFFARAAAAWHADVVALGHTRDDQAETFLLRLLRGAGARGLASMYPRAGVVIRPLLDSARADVQAFLDHHGIPSLHDESNDDVAIPRNRIRAELLPLLKQKFNPGVVDALASSAQLARMDEAYLQAAAQEWLRLHVRTGPAAWRVDAESVAALPGAVGWRVVQQLMISAAAGRAVGFDDVERAWKVVSGETSRFDGPGQRVERVGSDVVLTGRPAGSAGRPPAGSSRPVAEFRHALPIPGEVAIAEIGCVMSAEVAVSVHDVPPPDGVMAIVPKHKVAGGLAVRNRRAGDRLRATAVGRRKLQDLLVDRKVPREARDRLPIVVDAQDRIVWVAGYVVDREFRVTDPAQAVVVLRLKGVGGSC